MKRVPIFKNCKKAFIRSLFALNLMALSACSPQASPTALAPTSTLPAPQVLLLATTTATIPPETLTPTIFPETTAYLEVHYAQTPTLIEIERPPLESVQYEVPFQSQEGLTYKGVPTKAGCTAASAAMILNYWKAENSDFKTLSAQKLIDINVAQGTFNRQSGLAVTKLEDELKTLGYVFVPFRNSDKETLLTALAELGPQALLVKTEWVPTGANHLVVLTGYDAETDAVTINDPWYDAPLSLLWDAFDGIWSLNYSENENGYLVRTFFTIHPSAITELTDQ